jgi:hypothetical protein
MPARAMRVQRIPDGEHIVHLEKASEVNWLIRQFVAADRGAHGRN